MDAGERGDLGRRFQPIVKPDDGHVIRNPPSRLAQRLHRPKGLFVIAGEHGGKLDPGVHELIHR